MEDPSQNNCKLKPAEYRAVLRQDFYTFLRRCFAQLNPRTQFFDNWHLELIADRLEACRLGKIRRLIINVPPRHLKSLSASIAFPAWCLGHNPAAQILCVSYAQDLADKHARECRSLMTSRWYKALFPTRLARQKQAVQEFVTTAEGFRFSTSVGGVLTGRGADLIIIDDPLKPDEAVSETRRKAVNDWFDHTLYSRLNDKQTGCIVIIMQRLHEDDLVGHVLDQEDWEVLRLPAIAEENQSFKLYNSEFGPPQFERVEGELLHEEREPRATLDQIRATLGEYNFAGQYQQVPTPSGGGIIKTEWFKRYEPADLPERFDQIVQSWDTANKPTELADYSVCTTWGRKEKRIYLLNVLRKRLGYPDLKRTVREQAQAFEASVVLIEDKASGTQLIQDLIAEGLYAVTRYAPEGDKVMRLHAQTGVIENGFVYLPREAPWLPEFLHELSSFPNGKYDDEVDSMSQALDWIKKASAGFENALRWLIEQATIERYRQGMLVRHIAADVGQSLAEVQRTIDQYEQERERLQEIYESAVRKNCARCGEPVDRLHEWDGANVYHPECGRIMRTGR